MASIPKKDDAVEATPKAVIAIFMLSEKLLQASKSELKATNQRII